jgi:WD40 repeat protein/beta-lactamase regulating signal transducer with metallopeptidase domain
MIHASEWIVIGLLRASAGLSLAALAVAACAWWLRLRAPRAEQWAWLLVLVQGVILVPASIPISRGYMGAWALPQSRTDAPTSDAPRVPAEAGREIVGANLDREPAPRPATIVSPQSEPSVAGPPAEASRFSWAVVAFTAWLAGVCALVGLGVLRYGAFAGRMHRARWAPPRWQAEWRRVLEEQVIRTPIPLLVSRDVGPALCRLPSGCRLVVPESFWAGLEPIERTAIMRHELAHYRRGDLWTTLLARGLAVVQWFNPLSWWAVARFEAQSEFLCDRAATPDDPSAFAETLMRLASIPGDRIAVGPAARAGSLFERIRRLLTDSPQPPGWRRAAPIAVAIVALGTTALRLQPVGASGMSGAGQGVETTAQGPGPPLPPRALVQFGTAELRTRNWIIDIAFSPDGRLIAAAEPNTDFPTISLFDVGSRRLFKRIEPTIKPKGWVHCLAFSPDGTKVLWGEVMGWVALWDLAGDRLIFRERFHGGRGLDNNVVVDEAAYSGTVNDVAFSPDGRLAASASIDGQVRLRRVDRPAEAFRDFRAPWSETGRRSRLAGGGPRPAAQPGLESARRVVFTPDGSRLVIGSATTISVWRIEDGRLVRRIERAHGDRQGARDPGINSLAVTPDGRSILSAGYCTVPPNLTRLAGLPKNVNRVNVSEVRLWDIESGERVGDLSGGDHQGSGSAALSRDGRRVAVCDRGSIRLLDLATGRVERTIPLPGSSGAHPAFSPDGTVVALAFDETIGLFDVQNGRRLHDDEGMPRGEPVSAAWSPAGDRVVTGHRDGGVRVWEVASGKLAWHKLLGSATTPRNRILIPNFVAFARDGRRVVAAGGADTTDGRLAIYRADSGVPVREVDQPEITEAALSPDGRILVTAGDPRGSHLDKHLRGIELDTGRTRWTSPADADKGGWLDLRWMQFRPDSSLIELAQGTGDVIRLNALTGREVRRSRFDWRPRDQQKPAPPGVLVQLFGYAAFSDDGRTLASFAEKAISVWDVEAGTLRRTIPHAYGDGCYLAISPDGRTLATSVRHYLEPASEDKIRLYDLDTGELALTLEPPDDRAVVLAFSPDGTRLLAGFHRGTAIVWDVRRPGR